MPALQSLTVLAAPRPETLCRSAEQSCAACCWGEAVPRATLERRLRRQTSWFGRLVAPNRPPSRLRLLMFELLMRRGADLILAPLLALPLLGDLLRPWLARRLSCAFLGFTDDGGQQIGCLLHPTRWHGRDRRRQAAFALLRGCGCGKADYFCLGAWRYSYTSLAVHQEFRAKVTGADWFAYSRVAQQFGRKS